MKKKDKNNKQKEINIEIRKAFGKYYIFSIVLFIIMFVSSFLFNHMKPWFSILLVVFYLIFFIIMLLDLYRKKEKYWTSLASILILLFIMFETLDILRIVFFLIK